MYNQRPRQGQFFTHPQRSRPGGHDYQFVEEPPDSLKCLICLLVAKDPQQHGGCGKLFCQTCIATYRGQRNDCPHCRQPLHNFGGHITIFNDFKSDQEVKSLQVICNKECGWKGELRMFEQHIEKDCENAEVFCPNGCQKRLKIVRKNLKDHLKTYCPRRKTPCKKCLEPIEHQQLNHHHLHKCPKRQYRCPYCNLAGCFDERTTTHLQVCPKVKIRCPKCLAAIFRCDNMKHSETCPHEPVACKYYKIGCKMKPLRKELMRHEKDAQFHLTLATERVLELTKAQGKRCTFKLIEFASKRKKGESFLGPHFLTSQFGYKMYIEVDPNGWDDGEDTHVSVFAYLMKGDYDDSLTWPFTGTVTIELLNQLEDRNHYEMNIIFHADRAASQRVMDESEDGWGETKFISHQDLHYKSDKNCQYLKDDTLVFRVSVEVPDHKPWLECTS